MFRIISLLLCISILLGCTQNKCVKISDASNKILENVTLKFIAILKPNNEKLGALVTNPYTFYEKNIGESDKKGNICFENYNEENIIYSYSSMWEFRKDELIQRYSSYNEIPKNIVLYKSKDHINNLEDEINLGL